LRSSALAVSILSASTHSATLCLRLWARCSAASEPQYGKRFEGHFKKHHQPGEGVGVLCCLGHLGASFMFLKATYSNWWIYWPKTKHHLLNFFFYYVLLLNYLPIVFVFFFLSLQSAFHTNLKWLFSHDSCISFCWLFNSETEMLLDAFLSHCSFLVR